MSKNVWRWRSEADHHGLCAEEKAIRLEHSGEIELTDEELAAVYGAYGESAAPVSSTCLQSILLGEGHCGTQSLGKDYFNATVSKDPR